MLSIVLVPVTVGGIVFAGFVFLPLPASLPDPRPIPVGAATEVYDSQGNLIATFRAYDQNVPVAIGDIPDVMKQAVIAAEDKNFYEHSGIDPRGIARAVLQNAKGEDGRTQGGSTITQQYVKNAYTGDERTIVRKIREAVLASQLDRQVPKEEILYRYLSSVFLGNGIYGVGAAAESYFRKPVGQLTLSEAAIIAGLLPAPSRYEPRGNPENAEGRRKVVLGQMLAQGRVTQAEYDLAISQVVWRDVQGPPPGPATIVYSQQEDPVTYPYFVDYVRRILIERYGQDAVYGGGLRVVTTIDPAMQAAAEEAVTNAIGRYDAPLEMALVAVEPPTGFVKALVGGRDFAASSVNLALGGCYQPGPGVDDITVQATCWGGTTVEGGGTGRQPGSSFKPFVLAAAFEQGISPDKTYNAPSRFYPPGCKQQSCSVGNYDGSASGKITLKVAMSKSVNTVFAQLVRDVGFDQTAEMTKKLGITSAWYAPSVHGTSGNYSLGTIDVSPLDMASAYSVFANRGLRQEPTPIISIVDGEGNVLEDNTARTPTRVIDENVADNVTSVLRGVITGGTGKRANIGRPVAGKTGTTNDYKDAWFVGYTPTLSTAVWMGYSDKPRPMRLSGVGSVAGGTVPAPTFAAFMKVALADVPVTEFNEPVPIKKYASARSTNNGKASPGPRQPAKVTPTTSAPAPTLPPPTVPPTTTEPPPTTSEPDGGTSTGP